MKLKRSVISRSGVGTTASVLQRNDLLLHTFVSDYPSLILLKRGTKTVLVNSKKIVLKPGDAVALAAGTTCDVKNETDEGQFESTWIVCDPSLIERFNLQNPKLKELAGFAALKNKGPEFVATFERAVKAVADLKSTPVALARHRLEELLVWLAQGGVKFSAKDQLTLPRRLRLMVGADPRKRWSSGEVADAFAMSEATFRRKLAQDGQAFNDILIDVRMTTALTLLQVSDLSVSEIASQVGYESASRFSVRFKKRFGFSPTAVRGAHET